MSEPVEPKPKRKPRLKPRQRMFAKEIVAHPELPARVAVMAVYGGNPLTAETRARQLLEKPHVREHITEAVDRLYPDIAATCAQVLTEFLTDSNLSPSTRMKAMKMLGEYFGWKAATVTKNLTLKADMDKFKLPGES